MTIDTTTSDTPPTGMNPIVWMLRKIAVDGNVVPHTFFRVIRTTTERGKSRPHLLAICILSEIMYWYRPAIDVDEKTGVATYRQKFRGDQLQKSYADLASKFGAEKRQIKEACDLLRRLNLITTEFRTLEVAGLKLNNVMFVAPRVETLQEILFPKEGHHEGVVRNSVGDPTKSRTRSSQKKNEYPTNMRKTNTHTTSETISKTTTSPVVVELDQNEEQEYSYEMVVPHLPPEVITAIDYVIARYPHISQNRIRHAAWVLYFRSSSSPVKMWPHAIIGTINKGIWHPVDCPTPTQLLRAKNAMDNKNNESRLKREAKEKRDAEIEEAFSLLPDSEKERLRDDFRRRSKIPISVPDAIEAGAIAEFASHMKITNG